MSLKKNALSYIIWVIMLLFTGAGVAFLGLVATRMLAGENILIAVGIIAVFFLVLFLIYLLLLPSMPFERYCDCHNADAVSLTFDIL